MSVANFIPQLWFDVIMTKLKKTLVYGDCVNHDYEGAISQAGDSVKINGIGPVTIRDYDKDTELTIEELSDQSQTLVIDQKKYFAFKVDDVDKRQAKGDIEGAGMAEAAYGLKDVFDQFIAGLYKQAGATTDATAINSKNAYAALLALGQKLDEKNVPQEGRWCVIPPWLHAKLVLAKLLTENTTNDAQDNGRVGRLAGFDLRKSNNVPIVGGTNYKITAGTTRAISVANQILNTEAVRIEKGFGDMIKGLHVYGGKVVDPDQLVVLDATVAAES